MTTAKHTPGPWAVREGFRYGDWEIYPARDGPPDFGDWADLANVTGDYGDDDGDEGRANAHLIAAAPDLKAFAEKVRDFAREIDDDGLYQAADSVIAKAEGRS